MKEVLSFGAGVQSTTLLLMSCVGELPQLDHVVFADPQWEPAAVYRHLEWCQRFAERHGITIEVRTAGDLRADLVDFWGQRKSADGKRHASIPAFIKNPDGSRGMVRRQCTGTYKIDVVERFIRETVLQLRPRQRWPQVPTVRQWIGISNDERQRMRVSPKAALLLWYPLVEFIRVRKASRLFPTGMDRADCLEWIDRHGFPRPPRSACKGCPFRSDAEWAAMKRDDPDSFADAVATDHAIRAADRSRIGETVDGTLVGEPYLHSSLVPLDLVAFDGSTEEGRAGMQQECVGMCGS